MRATSTAALQLENVHHLPLCVFLASSMDSNSASNTPDRVDYSATISIVRNRAFPLLLETFLYGGKPAAYPYEGALILERSSLYRIGRVFHLQTTVGRRLFLNSAYEVHS